MSDRYVAVFSVGPVQSFIASARKTEDLWSGSYILSFFVRKALECLYEKFESKFQLLYPKIPSEEIRHPNPSTVHIASVPNRFTALLTANRTEVENMLAEAETAVRKCFRKMFRQSVCKLFSDQLEREKIKEMIRTGKKQIDSLLEIYWVAEPYPDSASFKEVRERAESRLAAIKNDKQFPQMEQIGLTCSVCHERQALVGEPITEDDSYGTMKRKLIRTWSRRHTDFRKKEDSGIARIKDNEFLCGVCLTKRLARDYFKNYYKRQHGISSDLVQTRFSSFKSTVDISDEKEKYYGIIMIDGDNMGEWFSGENPEDYGKVSEKLKNYSAQTVPSIVEEKYNGMLIYAGGDDVLAFLPLSEALAIANELRFSFSDGEKGLDKSATSSGGLVIAHEKSDMRMALQAARALEAKAKAYRKPTNSDTDQKKDEKEETKNALAIAVHTRSGEQSETVLPWLLGEKKTIDVLIRIVDLLKNELSDTFIFQFIDGFHPLLPNENAPAPSEKFKKVPKCFVQTELVRLISRSAKRELPPETIKEYVDDFMLIYENVPTTMDFIHTLKILSFFGRKERES